MIAEEYLPMYRHSLAHVLAKAVRELYAGESVQLAIGPEISYGLYYDFGLPHPITEADFPAINAKMKEIIKRDEPFVRKEVSKEQARELFADQKYKLELIDDMPDDEVITAYYTGDDFVDLCRGPHVSSAGDLAGCCFEVSSTSAAYWRGDEHNDMLQRVYVTAFPTKEEMKEHKEFLKEAKERDHKVLGPKLDLFFFDPTAPGMPYWLPKGWKLFNTILDFWREEHEARGYQEISSPQINRNSLWITSGHWDHYRDGMFVIDMGENDVYGVKPMNCPNAIVVYKRTRHSYKELPLRYSDCDVLHRFEKSGELNGLLRVQMFRQDDSHNFITEDQISGEVNSILDIADRFYGIFGLTYRPELSTRPEDFMGDVALWDKAEAELRAILDARYGEDGYDVNEGDGAFYGPKIDIMMKDALNRQWQMGTIQLDFQLPRNFDLTYIDEDNSEKVPVLIHRVIYGSLERFIGILIENFKGAFPFWISPIQVGIVPIRPNHNEYATKLLRTLKKHRVRAEANTDSIHMNKKIREYKSGKVPYTVIIGDDEVANKTVSINIRGGAQVHGISVEDFIRMCDYMNEAKTIELIQSPDEVQELKDEDLL